MVSVNNVVQINEEKKYKKPGAGAVIGGVLAGSTVAGAAKLPAKYFSPKIMEKMQTLSGGLTQDEFKQVEKAAAETIKKSGLADKGVSIVKATTENMDEVNRIIAKEFDNNIILKHLPQKIREKIKAGTGGIASMIQSGKNACYTFHSKKILMPKNKLGLAVFHEAGHACNNNLSKFGKILQKCRPMSILALPIAMIALFKTKKAEGEKPKNAVDKVTTFIKENAGKLTFAAFLPVLAEEGLATLKGNKFAKQLLSPELAKKVAKTNAFGFSTYLLKAALSGLGIFAGTKVKDAIAHKKAAV